MASTLKKGSSGSEVSEWQELLSAAGYPVVPTGTFDDATLAATKSWQAAKGLVADGIVGPASWAAMTGKTSKTYPLYYRDNAQFGRTALQNVWKSVTGEEPTLAELQIAGAQAHLESNYGKASYKLLDHTTGQTIATSGPINNWGAVQTASGPPEGFLATDTGPSHVTADNPKGYYDHHYKVYATPEDGARHLVEHLTLKRPTSWAHMKAGDIDAWAAQMWAGKLPDGKLNKDPQSGMLGYFEQKPAARAKGIEERVWAISDALGEPVAARRGGPYEGPEPAPGDQGGGFLPSLIPRTPGQRGFVALLGASAALALGWAAWHFKIWRRLGPGR